MLVFLVVNVGFFCLLLLLLDCFGLFIGMVVGVFFVIVLVVLVFVLLGLVVLCLLWMLVWCYLLLIMLLNFGNMGIFIVYLVFGEEVLVYVVVFFILI